MPLIAMDFAFAGGVVQDPARQAWVANVSPSAYSDAAPASSTTARSAIDSIAAPSRLSYNVTRDYTRGSLRTLKDNRDEAFDLRSLSMTAPRFDAEPLERIEQIMSSLRRELSHLSSLFAEPASAQRFENHPYGCAQQRALETVPTITADTCALCEAHLRATC